MIKFLVASYIFFGFLSGCDSPHPTFMSVEKQVIQVQGSTFHIRVKENKVHAIRTNFERIPKTGDTFSKAVIAIEQASECKVVPGSMRGDPAVMMAKLDC